MARLSNHIEDYLRALLLEREGQIEIKRNVLAEHFNCAPSQINYVLTTRFTPVQGFSWSPGGAAAVSFVSCR